MPLLSASWITTKRLRAHGLILALCLWSVYLWNISTPGLLDRAVNLKGTDFLHFYTLGSIALAHRGADLYNLQAQSVLAALRVPAAAGIRYLPLYPPQVSIFFAPLALCSYPSALILWITLNTILYAVCCYSIWRVSPNLRRHRVTVAILALAFPGLWNLIAWGQTSGIALAFFTVAYFALRSRHNLLAGLALGSLIFKPQLALAAALIFIVSASVKVIAGALVSAVAQLMAAWFYYGPGPLLNWMNTLRNVPHLLPLFEPKLYQTHSLRTFWTMLIPSPHAAMALYIMSGLVVCALTIACWQSRLPLSARYSAMLLATVLVSPHLTVYDLVILAPAFLLLSDYLLGMSIADPNPDSATDLSLLLYVVFAAPLIGPLAQWTHFQLSVPALAATLFAIWQLSRKPGPAPNRIAILQ